MYSLIMMAAVASASDTSAFHWHRHGCSGCYGSTVVFAARPAPVVYSVGCYGTPGYVVGGWQSYHGCAGCTGSCSGWGPSFYSAPVFVGDCGACYSAVATPTATPGASPSSGVANIKIELPADAKLVVDGQTVPGAGTVRSFATPKLPAGKSFVYEMKAETIVDGITVQEDLKVVVHAGDQLEKSFPKLLAAARKESPTEVARK
ncbi:TIGR03000 domain-containing protein [Limnoglobus roseus]|uniref:TIGR03000 domain-containing protein n=1 Tax=Limnoglobus roseus TaxID=2598579 RepID=A0A5C1ANJ5_9BACT|nr:TIGR03000 domain-containing protein [Limnoglobus roseus]QEL19693.1 TIGR03000 domain-containing protein [Limnoglobus roseus]